MINADLPIPLHAQISNLLEKQIRVGAYQEKIPSERELMDMYAVSRTTVREAVSKLVNEGKLQKVHGKGTFISKHPPIQEWLTSLNSFTDTVIRTGMNPSSRLLYSGKLLQQDGVKIFEFNKDAYLIERLRFADNIPVAIEKHFYPSEIGIKLSAFDLNTATIYDLLENELSINLSEAEQSITTHQANKQEAAHLEIPESSTVLCTERVIYDQFGRAVESYQGLYRPDMYVFRIKIKRKLT